MHPSVSSDANSHKDRVNTFLHNTVQNTNRQTQSSKSRLGESLSLPDYSLLPRHKTKSKTVRSSVTSKSSHTHRATMTISLWFVVQWQCNTDWVSRDWLQGYTRASSVSHWVTLTTSHTHLSEWVGGWLIDWVSEWFSEWASDAVGECRWSGTQESNRVSEWVWHWSTVAELTTYYCDHDLA